MKRQITVSLLNGLEPPEHGNRIVFDSEVSGFGARITAAGARSFILDYRIHGRRRRYTIGAFPEWTPLAARDEAVELRKEIRDGHDPLAGRVLDRTAPLMVDLAERYMAVHAEKDRPDTIRNKQQMINVIILPKLGKIPVAAITADDVLALHNALAGTPYQANRTRACLSSMFSFAVSKKMRADNPITKDSVPKYPEEKRERWLDKAEIKRLNAALDAHLNQSAANAIRLILFTGSRKGETRRATWDQFDLKRGVWRKPSAHTKQKRVEHIPLSEPAVRLLKNMRAHAEEDDMFLFPGRGDGQPIEDLKGVWGEIRKSAKLDGARIHDLRHTYASHLVSGGTPLAHVGRLLGHTQAQTTERYAHLSDDVLRKATNDFGKIVNRAR